MPSNKMQFTNISSPMGDMVAGATQNGVSFLEWHDRGGLDRIFKRITKRYKLPLENSNNNFHLKQLQKELNEYFDGGLKKFNLKIDVTGTAFERQVWGKLLEIPYGKTHSYSELAEIVGKPKAARAVGKANGANYLAILIPCHRIITADGGLGGYGGKIWRKKQLLELEKGIHQETF